MIDYPDVVETTAIKCKSSQNSKSSINMQNVQISFFFFFSSSLLKRFHTYVYLAPFFIAGN